MNKKPYKIINGNMLEILPALEENTFDSCITDPPYELNFMGKSWDNSGVAFQKETWQQVLRVLKPGAYLLAFGGTRTYHRIACAIEDAGFEIKDCIMWLYGSGFPKSMDISKAIESKILNGSANTTEFKKLKGEKVESGNWGMSKMAKDQNARPTDYSADKHLRTTKVDYQTEEGKKWEGWGTQLKPAYEPIIVARKPCEKTTTENVMTYGTGAINIDECRVGDEIIKGGTIPDLDFIGKEQKKLGNPGCLSFGQVENAPRIECSDHIDRFPANVILTYDETDKDEVCGGMWNNEYRYFYCAKASKKDRDEGLDLFETQEISDGCRRANPETSNKLGSGQRFGKNIHPTVKPTELMQYLIRLTTRKGGGYIRSLRW